MVKKKEVLIALIAIGLMIIIGQMYLIRNQVIFDGDRVCSKDPGRYCLIFNLMNTDDSATMTLHEGDTLHVTWQIDGGKADVMIAMKNEVPIYRADKCKKGENADFELLIPKTGEYTTTISARHARGWIDITEK